jgi:ribosomal protein L12E/L44/L45/RPP1/RPP2
MLKELAIPMNSEEVEKLAIAMDADGSGSIDFNEFLDWYSAGGTKTLISVKGKLLSSILQIRHAIMELSNWNLIRRAERDVLRQCSVWLSKRTRTLYRENNPPKFQCCQCMQPFVLFTDFYSHYDEEGFCLVTEQKALYYPDFWLKDQWRKQREVERELMRHRDEEPAMHYASTIAVFADLALQSDSAINARINFLIGVAKRMFIGKLQDPNQSKSTAEMILDIVNMSKEGTSVEPFIAKCVSKCLGKKLPEDWIVHSRWSLEEFLKWVKASLSESEKCDADDPSQQEKSAAAAAAAGGGKDSNKKGSKKQQQKDQNADSTSGKKKTKNSDKKTKKKKKNSSFAAAFCDRINPKQCLLHTKRLLIDSGILAKVYVRCLRLMLVSTEASLIALMEMRKRRPRMYAYLYIYIYMILNINKY